MKPQSESADVINQSKQIQERTQSLRAEYQALLATLGLPQPKTERREKE